MVVRCINAVPPHGAGKETEANANRSPRLILLMVEDRVPLNRSVMLCSQSRIVVSVRWRPLLNTLHRIAYREDERNSAPQSCATAGPGLFLP